MTFRRSIIFSNTWPFEQKFSGIGPKTWNTLYVYGMCDYISGRSWHGLLWSRSLRVARNFSTWTAAMACAGQGEKVSKRKLVNFSREVYIWCERRTACGTGYTEVVFECVFLCVCICICVHVYSMYLLICKYTCVCVLVICVCEYVCVLNNTMRTRTSVAFA